MLDTNRLIMFKPWSDTYHSIIRAKYMLKLETHNLTFLSDLLEILMDKKIEDEERVVLHNDLSNLLYLYNKEFKLEDTENLLEEYYKFRGFHLERSVKDSLNVLLKKHREDFVIYYKVIYNISDSILPYELTIIKGILIVNLAIGIKE